MTVGDLHCDGEGHDGTWTGALGDTIATPAGPLVPVRAAGFTPGEEVRLDVVRTPLAATAKAYESHLTVTMSDDKGTVINLSVTDESTQRAQELLNTLIAVYNESWIRDKNRIAVSTSNFINDRLGVIESELGNVDSDISSFKSEHLIPDVEAASSMYMNQNQQISQDILALNNQLQMTRYIRSYLTSDAYDGQLLPSNTGIENPGIVSQIEEYNRLLLQRNSLIEKSSEKNPLVVTLDGQLASVRGAIIASVDNSIMALTTQMRNLQGSQAATTSKIASNPTPGQVPAFGRAPAEGQGVAVSVLAAEARGERAVAGVHGLQHACGQPPE